MYWISVSVLLSLLVAGFAAPLSQQWASVNGQQSIVADPIANRIPLRIMPLGASITWGQASSDGNGYRSTLRNLLTAGGNPVNMVGSRQHGNMKDNDVEGWPGYVIDQVYAKANESVPTYKPNVVLINAGTNDCLQNKDTPNAGKRMRAMVEHLYDMSPRTTVVLSSLIVNKDSATDARALDVNKQYQALVTSLKAQGRRIVFVEMHGSNGPQLADMSDQTHPNDAGYRKMAAIWHTGLVEAGTAGLLLAPESVSGIPDDGDSVS